MLKGWNSSGYWVVVWWIKLIEFMVDFIDMRSKNVLCLIIEIWGYNLVWFILVNMGND